MTQPFILQWIVVSVVTAAAATAWADPPAKAPVAEEPVEVWEATDVEMMVEPVPENRPVGPPALERGLFGAGLRAIFDVIAPVPQPALPPIPADEAEDGEMPKDPAQAQLWQQRKQIRQQAKHLEQLFQPVLRTELEMIRQTCGTLAPESRQRVLAVGKAAVTQTALEFATRQMLGGQPRRPFDARRSIQEPLAKEVEPQVSAAEFAAYQREQRLRVERRGEAARVAIVAKLDRQLDLTAVQRGAIESDLEQRWDDAWLRELDDQGVVMNNYRPAPDYANGCIEPHLDESQQAEWQRWRRAAGIAVVGVHAGWNFDGQGLHQEDDWWTK